jgi:pimeloyl-ACP methyl ester carboxylesterase
VLFIASDFNDPHHQRPVAMEGLRIHIVDTVLGPLSVGYKKRDKSRGKKKSRKDENCIMFWPSLFCDSTMYNGLIAQLQRSSNTSLILIDGPAHGGSPNHIGKFSMEECGIASKEILDHFKEKTCHYIGTSWGGLAAAWLAVSEPDRVKSLVLISMNCDLFTFWINLTLRSRSSDSVECAVRTLQWIRENQTWCHHNNAQTHGAALQVHGNPNSPKPCRLHLTIHRSQFGLKPSFSDAST